MSLTSKKNNLHNVEPVIKKKVKINPVAEKITSKILEVKDLDGGEDDLIEDDGTANTLKY